MSDPDFTPEWEAFADAEVTYPDPLKSRMIQPCKACDTELQIAAQHGEALRAEIEQLKSILRDCPDYQDYIEEGDRCDQKECPICDWAEKVKEILDAAGF